ncbi:ABC transporter permease [Salipiger sp. 1_MG-2023]|uniref:ABC transporter permease n=1 Tax=Salipiger sp. 1_MG-2023 TaxID=3062665 RepID=UPI0026E1AB64|nr:ABC transporter permease [Salipiger sp. 1_MG-2023]MDO6586411.1 ABC transporter permease [Salipiger sp. 1_MG-2023]
MIGAAARAVLAGLLLTFVLAPGVFAPLLAPLAQENGPVIYERASLLSLSLSHLGLVVAASVAATAVAVTLAILVTRPFGAAFRPLARSVANLGQTFPPVAVLALAVPMMGFGAGPTLLALFLYGLLPIFENAMTGLTALPPATLEAARGIGMTPRQRLLRVELPLALPVILAGVRLSVVIALGTATIGSTVAARTLGEVIIAGLLTSNTAFVVQGGLVVGLFAVLLHDALVQLERRLSGPRRSGG